MILIVPVRVEPYTLGKGERELTPTRKQQMIIQSRELEALQKKIREAEDRLKARETPTVPEEGSEQNNGASDNSRSGEF